MTIAIDTGKKFKKPKIELSVAVIGSVISFVASVDVEKCLENKLKFTLAVFLATILSLLFSTLIMLFNIFYLDKAAYISKYITLSITIVTDHLPATLEKTTPYLISFYQDLCRTLTSETLVWILTFWCLMPSTGGSFQLRFRYAILIHVVHVCYTYGEIFKINLECCLKLDYTILTSLFLTHLLVNLCRIKARKKKTAILLYLKDLMVSCPSCTYNTRPVPGGLQF